MGTKSDSALKCIEEYSFGSNRIKYTLMPLWERTDSLDIALEDIGIDTLFDVCQKKTRKAFMSTRSILKGFYQYLQQYDKAALISEFQYESRIRYFKSVDELLSYINTRIKIQFDSGEIYDIHQHDTKRVTMLLYAIGLTPNDIAALKWSDYNSENSTLKVDGRIVTLPEIINTIISFYQKSDGFVVRYGKKSTRSMPYVDGDSLIKLSKKNATMCVEIIYRINHDIVETFDIDYIDIKKSYEIWELLKLAGYEINAELPSTINWNKIQMCIVNSNSGVSESEVRDFLGCI